MLNKISGVVTPKLIQRTLIKPLDKALPAYLNKRMVKQLAADHMDQQLANIKRLPTQHPVSAKRLSRLKKAIYRRAHRLTELDAGLNSIMINEFANPSHKLYDGLSKYLGKNIDSITYV